MNPRYPSAFAAFFVAAFTQAQQGPNLVTNPGFETLVGPVTTWDQLDHATGWSNANAGTADIFSKDACSSSVGMPDSELGNAPAFEGEHYAGFVAFKDQQRPNHKRLLHGTEDPRIESNLSYSEYIQMPMSAALVAGQKYDISLRVRLSSNSDRAVSAIGGYCSPTQLAYAHNHFINEKPQVFSTAILSDKGNWVEVKGSFVADGTEKFLIVGAFPAAGMEKSKVIEGGDSQRAYYFVDAVSVNLHPEPDTDGDGVIDKEDNCPTEKGLKTLGGCPDRDGDGVADKMDACPDKAGSADKQGCPDTDGDGLTDNVDKCPLVAGTLAMKGCPEVAEKTKQLFARALNGVKFETGKSTIKKESFAILDEVVKVMQENPTYNLQIDGHTDDQGDAALNKKLSDDRAAAVRAYLEGKGIGGSRMKSAGYGEDQPVADNKTSAGRAKNRRVEFKVDFWE